MGNSLRRAIPVFLSERQLRQEGGKPENASLEVQILSLAEEYEALTTGQRGTKMSPSQASEEVMKRAQIDHPSLWTAKRSTFQLVGGISNQTGAYWS